MATFLIAPNQLLAWVGRADFHWYGDLPEFDLGHISAFVKADHLNVHRKPKVPFGAPEPYG